MFDKLKKGLSDMFISYGNKQLIKSLTRQTIYSMEAPFIKYSDHFFINMLIVCLQLFFGVLALGFSKQTLLYIYLFILFTNVITSLFEGISPLIILKRSNLWNSKYLELMDELKKRKGEETHVKG